MLNQLRRGSTETLNRHRGLRGELTVDLEAMGLRLHDGQTPGGFQALGKQVVAVTGPGPTNIKFHDPGTNDAFYGELPTAELITVDELEETGGLTAGVRLNSDPGWLKVRKNNTILFIAKKPFRHSIAWSQINAQDLVSGNRIININGLTYKVRLLTTANENPIVNTDLVNQSEWYRFINSLRGLQAYPGWKRYTDADLGMATGAGDATWCQEIDGKGNAAIRNNSSTFYLRPVGDTMSSRAWRPVLELVE